MSTKPTKKYYKIGEVAQMFGVNASLLRHWEKHIKDLSPIKTDSGERLYRQSDLEFIEQIYTLTKTYGYTLKGASEALRVLKKSPDSQRVLLEKLLKVREHLQTLRYSLEEVEKGEGGNP